MSLVTVNAGGINIVLNLPNGPLPTVDPLTGRTWTQYGGGELPLTATPPPQPGTYDKALTNPAGN